MGDVAGSNPTGRINANTANIRYTFEHSYMGCTNANPWGYATSCAQLQASAPPTITKPTFKDAPSTSGIFATAHSAHLGQPIDPSSSIRLQRLLFDVHRSDVSTQNDFYEVIRNNARYHTGRSK
jgi:hypothetical protein